MIFESWNIGFVIISKFSISAITYACAFAIIPNKTFFIVGNGPVAFGIIIASSAPITGYPCFFQIVGCIGSKTPVMSIGTYFAIYIKII